MMTEDRTQGAGDEPVQDRPDEELVAQLVERARAEELDLIGPDVCSQG